MSQDDRGESSSPRRVSEREVPSLDDVGRQGVLSLDDSESLDAVFRALADYRRRCVCHYLVRSEEPLGVADLAERVAASTSGTSRAVLTDAAVEKSRAELVRMHLPRLADAGIVEYDREAGRVELAESPGVRACLRAASTVDLE
ncbi:DUF7344 domain-containing protein [Halorussus litoreus]|uniref:DUF7344 domain-containing protein n=1 Tax=Halorussus litoreus TaxID=1710536 RepID=UPI000E2569BF|nr:hypothetical protein [Halorussus litoreus]